MASPAPSMMAVERFASQSTQGLHDSDRRLYDRLV
jgi:hypothetical protein